jgi:hypothetical protein
VVLVLSPSSHWRADRSTRACRGRRRGPAAGTRPSGKWGGRLRLNGFTPLNPHDWGLELGGEAPFAYRLIAFDVDGLPLLIQVWARGYDELHAWLPTAMTFVDSVRFGD